MGGESGGIQRITLPFGPKLETVLQVQYHKAYAMGFAIGILYIT